MEQEVTDDILDGIEVPQGTDPIEWYQREMHAASAEIALIRQRAKDRIEQLQSRQQAITRWIGPKVKAALASSIGDGRVRSIVTIYGRIGFRSRPDTVVIEDAAEALDWAKKHIPAAVRTTEELTGKSRFIEWVKDGGEVPPGVRFVGAQDDALWLDGVGFVEERN